MSSSTLNEKFIKLTDVFTDDNLVDNVATQSNCYVFYETPLIQDQVPSPSSPETLPTTSERVTNPLLDQTLIEYENAQIPKCQLIHQMLNTTNIESINQLESAIKSYNPWLNKYQFDILESYVNQLDELERENFFNQLLPAIIELALELPNVLTCDLPILVQRNSVALFLSQYQISSLLANGFLCTFNERFKDDYRCGNFGRMFCSSQKNDPRRECKLEKIKCFVNYFARVTQTKPTGTVSFERKTLTTTRDFSIPLPEESTEKICNLEFKATQLCMFEHGSEYATVDFANKRVGGGVLKSGAVQEEILFTICPELIVTKLFNERLGDKNALVITGGEQYSLYSGYGDKFKFKSNYNDPKSRDKYGRVARQVIAMDATSYARRAGGNTIQYQKDKIDREITKALCAFQPERFLLNPNRLPAIVTGNWGCGAYRGDPQLKTLIQIIAASMSKRDLIYFPFDNEKVKNYFDQIKPFLETRPHLTVSQFYNAILEFAEQKQNQEDIDLVRFFEEKFI